MSQLFYGSINLSELLEKAKAKHSGFTKGNNGAIYANVSVWLNDNVDKFGNIMSIQVNPSKDMKDKEERFYIGNCKQSEGPKPISDRDSSGLNVDLRDIPAAPVSGQAPNANNPEDSDLPF